MIRSGLIMKKIGMTRLFDEDGKHVPVTILLLDNMQVLCHRTEERDGYSALQIGYGFRKTVKKPQSDFYKKLGINSKMGALEFRVSKDAFADVGSVFSVNHFVVGQFVDVIGNSIGKGFAGGMKRHNFGGLRATHGVSLSHRSIGSTGNRTDPGRTFKNRKMPGNLGNSNVTIQNLRVFRIDSVRNIIFVKGAVPGHKNSFVILRDSKKKSIPSGIRPFVVEENVFDQTSMQSVPGGDF